MTADIFSLTKYLDRKKAIKEARKASDAAELSPGDIATLQHRAHVQMAEDLHAACGGHDLDAILFGLGYVRPKSRPLLLPAECPCDGCKAHAKARA